MFVPKALNDGQLPPTQAAIYTVPALTKCFLKNVAIGNTNAVSQTILFYIKSSGTARFWRRFVLAQFETADLIGGGGSVIMEAGDTIEAITTTPNAVDFTVWGVEVTP